MRGTEQVAPTGFFQLRSLQLCVRVKGLNDAALVRLNKLCNRDSHKWSD